MPKVFLDKMSRLLEQEMPAFLASYEAERLFGLRVNLLKLTAEQFLKLTSLQLKPIPWVENGFYYNEAGRPGKHPHYHAGLYYIQEPSAMAPVELLDVHPQQRVLDLCAAPGGKSTQIAGKLQGTGALVVNDIHPDRVKALVKNLELSGVRNAVVLNEQPDKLQSAFEGYFDRILIDAPCSGEGMFRKEEEMAKMWEPGWVERYAAMQRDLLRQAARMLVPGGRMVYSTCTFSPEENEAMIAEFLDGHPDFAVLPVEDRGYGWSPGRPDWVDGRLDRRGEVAGTVRLWPHRLEGEGHYAAVLVRRGEAAPAGARESAGGRELRAAAVRESASPRGERLQRRKGDPAAGRGTRPPARGASSAAEPLEAFRRFAAESLAAELHVAAVQRGDHLYAAPPEPMPDLAGIRVIRPGWYLGEASRLRFEPSHALALGLSREDALRSVSFTAADERAVRYLKGETLHLAPEELHVAAPDVPAKGYCLVCIDGFPVGWAKWQDGLLKNEYPPGWRWT